MLTDATHDLSCERGRAAGAMPQRPCPAALTRLPAQSGVVLRVAPENVSAALARKGIASLRIVTSAALRAPAEAIPLGLGLRPCLLRAVALRPPSEPPCGQRFLIATAAQHSFSTAC